jgi:hypothetical protein
MDEIETQEATATATTTVSHVEGTPVETAVKTEELPKSFTEVIEVLVEALDQLDIYIHSDDKSAQEDLKRLGAKIQALPWLDELLLSMLFDPDE